MKLLVRVPNWVGDAVMCIPALEAIRARHREAEISLLGLARVLSIYEGQGLADELLLFDARGRHAGFFGLERLAGELRARRFDSALHLQNAFQAAWIAWRAGVPERIGYRRDGRGLLLTRPVRVPRRGEIPAHESFYYLELLRRCGWLDALPPPPHIRLRISDAALSAAEARLAAAGAPASERAARIAIAPGAAYGSAKCWPVERFAALADRLMAEIGANVVLFGSAAERDVCERIASAMRARPAMLAGQTPIGELAACLARCRLFIGNDSGAMHVAAAAGIPVVAVFGPTDPEATAPLAPGLVVLREQVECSPCFLRHCPIDHRCMTRVSVERVFDAARAHLEKGTRPLA